MIDPRVCTCISFFLEMAVTRRQIDHVFLFRDSPGNDRCLIIYRLSAVTPWFLSLLKAPSATETVSCLFLLPPAILGAAVNIHKVVKRVDVVERGITYVIIFLGGIFYNIHV